MRKTVIALSLAAAALGGAFTAVPASASSTGAHAHVNGATTQGAGTANDPVPPNTSLPPTLNESLSPQLSVFSVDAPG